MSNLWANCPDSRRNVS